MSLFYYKNELIWGYFSSLALVRFSYLKISQSSNYLHALFSVLLWIYSYYFLLLIPLFASHCVYLLDKWVVGFEHAWTFSAAWNVPLRFDFFIFQMYTLDEKNRQTASNFTSSIRRFALDMRSALDNVASQQLSEESQNLD